MSCSVNTDVLPKYIERDNIWKKIEKTCFVNFIAHCLCKKTDVRENENMSYTLSHRVGCINDKIK